MRALYALASVKTDEEKGSAQTDESLIWLLFLQGVEVKTEKVLIKLLGFMFVIVGHSSIQINGKRNLLSFGDTIDIMIYWRISTGDILLIREAL